ncbi:hypothetical protein I4U23_001115 [Adineta vaga]|nr:hypothetical protein I4U23_001115 [Adineta vaga]
MSNTQLPFRNRLRSNSYDQAMSSEPSEGKTQNSALSQPKEQNSDEIYLVKWIEFNRERLPILLQNVNGPCPILAIVNILLLRKRIFLRPNATTIRTEQVIASIAEYILQIDSTKLLNEQQANYEQNIEDALAVLPKLTTGIDINLKFNGVDQFEYTRECIIFDLLGIQLYHGWIIDPQDQQLQAVVDSNASSYNQLVEKMIRQKQSDNGNLSRESLVIEQFLEENRSQLTHYGILKLNEAIRDNQLAVLFRNNHFNVVWKNQHQLLLLVSDQGYLNHPSIVFETLTDIDNNSTFTDGYGQVWQRPVTANTTRDRDLAVAIYNEERRQYYQEPPRQGYYYERSSRKSKKKHRNRSLDDDHYHDDCILL